MIAVGRTGGLGRLGLAAGRPTAFDPRMLFSSGQAGLIYPTNDITTLYQDNIGLTRTTAMSQPVGLALDTAQNLALGDDIKSTGFIQTVGASTTATYNPATGDGQCYRVDASNQSGVAFTLPLGSWYRMVIQVVSSGANLRDGAVNSTVQGFISSTATVFFQSTTSTFAPINTGLALSTPGTTFCAFKIVSLQRVLGNHSRQIVAIDRPVLQSDSGGLAEVYNGTSAHKTTATGGGSTTGFFWCGAIRLTKTGSAQTLFSSSGTNSGYRVRVNASNQLELAAGNGSAFVTVSASTSLAGGERFVLTAWHDGTILRAQVNNGTIATASMGAVTAGTAQITVGKDNNAALNYFGGWLYYQLHRQTVPTDSEIAQLKQWIAARVGVTL